MAKIKWYTKELLRSIDQKGKASLLEVAFDFEQYVKTTFTDPGDYKPYRREDGRLHWSASPGEPPAIDYGRLKASVTTNWSWSPMQRAVSGYDGEHVHEPDDGVIKPTWGDGKKVVVVGSNVDYSEDLEFGWTEGGVVVEPRPWLTPAFEDKKKEFLAKFLGRFGII